MSAPFTPGALSVGIDPHLFVVFGGTGDLARKMLLPALYQLLRRREFQDSVEVLAVATRDMTEDEYRAMAVEALDKEGVTDGQEWAKRHLRYQSISHGFEALRKRIETIESEEGLTGNRAFYLAIPPAVFDDTVDGLGKSGALTGGGWTRVVVEDRGAGLHARGLCGGDRRHRRTHTTGVAARDDVAVRRDQCGTTWL